VSLTNYIILLSISVRLPYFLRF